MKHSLNSATTKLGMEKEMLEPILERQRVKPEMLLLHLKGQIGLFILLKFCFTGVDKLRHTSPLFLHSFTDSESSPLLQTPHNIFIVGTIQLAADLGDADQINCPELIEK
jgi:hypothetical protein